MRRFIWLALVFALPASAQEPYAVGDRMTPFSLEDQHGEVRAVDGNVALLLFSRDMDGGDVLKEALGNAPPDLLAIRKAAYVADISGMPGLVARMFALPSMRRRPYPMLLDRDGEATKRLPDVEKQATLIELDDLEITAISHTGDLAEVRRAVGLDPDP